METGLKMLMHALLIGLILYVVMRFLLRQANSTAINRSVFLAALALAYMMLFGHGLPTRIRSF